MVVAGNIGGDGCRLKILDWRLDFGCSTPLDLFDDPFRTCSTTLTIFGDAITGMSNENIANTTSASITHTFTSIPRCNLATLATQRTPRSILTFRTRPSSVTRSRTWLRPLLSVTFPRLRSTLSTLFPSCTSALPTAFHALSTPRSSVSVPPSPVLSTRGRTVLPLPVLSSGMARCVTSPYQQQDITNSSASTPLSPPLWLPRLPMARRLKVVRD